MIRFLFKQPQPKRFNYKPRFYDETREYLESRKAAIRNELDRNNIDEGSARLHGSLSHAWRSQQNRKTILSSNRNVLYIVAILSAIAYYLLFT